MSNHILTIFYDGKCPLCTLEMQKLKSYDCHNLIMLEDLHQTNFESLFPHISLSKAMAVLHGEYQGKVLLALDVTHRAWSLVGRGAFVAPLQFPVIKQVAHLGYLFMAKYRQPISHFLYKRFGIGANVCDGGTCYEQSSNTNRRR